MKIIINRTWGGISNEAAENRTNPDFIKSVEDGTHQSEDSFELLQVVEIPDNASDWAIYDYDGMEHVIFVLDGRLYAADTDEVTEVHNINSHSHFYGYYSI